MQVARVIVGAGMWILALTMDLTVDWTMDRYLDWILDVVTTATLSGQPIKYSS